MRASGILLHISSLPSPHGIGTMGAAAKDFVDFLVKAGQAYWQILPVCPTSYGDSPYQSFSTFAGNPYFIDLDLLAKAGLLQPEEYESIDWESTPGCVNYGALYQKRYVVLHKACARLLAAPPADYADFLAKNAFWLPDYALFMALKDAHNGVCWQQWEEPLRRREPETLAAARAKYAADIDFWQAVQYLFYTQWHDLKAYANAQGIEIIGDLPIYVAEDSVDVWSCPQEFQLDENLVPTEVAVLDGFNELDEEGLKKFIDEKGLAMDLGDIKFCQEYFRSEKRDPTITEIKMIDTYWSDHCRHTTFGTILDDVQIDDAVVQKAFDRYMAMRADLGRENKPRCMMDLATIGAKELKKQGVLKNLDESEEINACTVKIKCDVNGKDEDWLFLFKNETHNHPTEIEPFGGAATCIGGAIRDPLSGRSYVYQAMRVTGAGDPLKPVSETLPGKLPQRKLVTTAAAGYSSYGNQIGLATGQVDEIYHPGYVAKRMEIGAVVGATPASHVRRECPAPGDVIVLLGGRTGRDGVGGATGSSKAHKLDSLEHCGAEVQKGNAPIERKLQRLFRREDACKMIKRCNDFGAGGVSVAIGELADGLYIDLNKVTKKYDGLDGTELAISESQERMAVALAPEDVDKFIAIANEENLEATPVAKVTEEKRLNMVWNGVSIVNISREFLNSNGAEKHQNVHVEKATVWQPQWEGLTFSQKMKNMVGDLNVCSKKGLSERFDSTIGAATVLMPFGGAYQLTPQNAMVAKLPVDGETSTCSGMSR